MSELGSGCSCIISLTTKCMRQSFINCEPLSTLVVSIILLVEVYFHLSPTVCIYRHEDLNQFDEALKIYLQ